jgi:hypothetical protein
MKTLTMKTLSKAVAASVLMLAGSQAISYELGAGFEASANVGVVSNYMWRGMTQTRNSRSLTRRPGSHTFIRLLRWHLDVQCRFQIFPWRDTEQDFYAGYGFHSG